MRSWHLTLGLVACVGCGTSLQFAQTNSSTVPLKPRSAQEVEVFTSGAPNRPYFELGIIESQQSSVYSTDEMSDIVAKMRAYAGKRGCDALVILSENKAVVGSSNQSHGSVSTLQGYRGACVVYMAAPPPAVAYAPPPVQAPTVLCVPNATQLCYGPGACQGGQTCLADGRGFSPCDCGTQQPTAPAPAAAPTPAVTTPQ